MGLEIEKKFLVKGDFKKHAYKAVHITQAYLSTLPGTTLRIRRADDKAYLTIKGRSNASGMSRFEWEKEIGIDDFNSLLELAGPGMIDKTRYLVKNNDGVHTWEVDEFYGDNEGLTVAEIELSSEDDSFDRPEWLGEEVTGIHRYSNSRLLLNPYKNWKED